MAVARTQKVENAKVLREELGESPHAILVDFQGLDVENATDLRRKLRESEARLRVVKNSTALRAIDELPLAQLSDVFVGQTAIAYTAADAVSMAKVLRDFHKEFETPTFKAGVVDGTPITQEEFDALADLPPREELIAKALYLMNYPITGFVTALNGVLQGFVVALEQIRAKKESGELPAGADEPAAEEASAEKAEAAAEAPVDEAAAAAADDGGEEPEAEAADAAEEAPAEEAAADDADSGDEAEAAAGEDADSGDEAEAAAPDDADSGDEAETAAAEEVAEEAAEAAEAAAEDAPAEETDDDAGDAEEAADEDNKDKYPQIPEKYPRVAMKLARCQRPTQHNGGSRGKGESDERGAHRAD